MSRAISRLYAVCGTLVLLAAMLFFLVRPARYMACVLDGLGIWVTCVLPAALPFLFLTSLFSNGRAFGKFSARLSPVMGKLFRVSGETGSVAVLSALSGYPVGARTLSELFERGRISKEEILRAARLCTTCGPVFLIGTVGAGMFSSPLVGAVLLAAHLGGVWGVCLLLRGKGKPATLPPLRRETKSGLYESIWSSVVSVLCVGATIALFSAFGQMLFDLLPLPNFTEPIVKGLVEMTGGCALLARSPSALSLAGCAFFVTFGGACVLAQQLAFLTKAGVKALPFLAVKLLQGLLAAGIAYGLGLLLF